MSREISFEEVIALLKTYYKENPASDAVGRAKEIDRISARPAALLSGCTFSFTSNGF